MAHVCKNCDHDFFDRHLETDRPLATIQETRRRRCRDCIDCHPPETAPIRERDRELVPS